jgi:hypothetical protein
VLWLYRLDPAEAFINAASALALVALIFGTGDLAGLSVDMTVHAINHRCLCRS